MAANTLKNSSKKFIPTSEPVLDGDEEKNVLQAIKTNWISAGGPFTKKLEEEFAQWVGTKYAIACSSGTAAIHLAVASLGLKPGDEIIIPDFTIICSASMPILHGVKPVLVDVDKYWCIDPTKIEEKITKRTKAIMPVHMYGNPANVDEIRKIAKKHNLFVIEDACAAQGAECGDRKAGAIGDVGCFSFYASKNITGGEGGMVVTNNEEIANMARLLRSHGFEKPRFIHRYLGFNYRMTDLQAAVVYAQLKNVDAKVKKRKEIASYYRTLLKGVKEVAFVEDPPWGRSTFWMFCLLINDSFGRSRDSIIELLGQNGIGSERFYTSMSRQPIFIKGGDERYPDVSGSYPVSQDVAKRGLYIPSGLGLSKKEQKRVIDTLLSLRVKGAQVVTPSFKREDERGLFVEAVNGTDWKNIIYGHMKKGSIMGNHYHKKTKVFFAVTNGSAKVDMIHAKSKEAETLNLKSTDSLVFNTWHSHAIRFLEDTDFIMAKSEKYDPLDPDTYEFKVPEL